jgi:hypothetical protein
VDYNPLKGMLVLILSLKLPITVEVFNEGIFLNLYIHNLPNTCHVGFLQELEFYPSLNTFNTNIFEK